MSDTPDARPVGETALSAAEAERDVVLVAPAPEAPAGPATEDARETAFCDALHQFACEMLNRGQESRGWTVHEHKRSAQIERECRDELLRLYRAATGEVVGTAELYDSHVGHLQETHPYPRDAMIPVDLVRREKEEG